MNTSRSHESCLCSATGLCTRDHSSGSVGYSGSIFSRPVIGVVQRETSRSHYGNEIFNVCFTCVCSVLFAQEFPSSRENRQSEVACFKKLFALCNVSGKLFPFQKLLRHLSRENFRLPPIIFQLNGQ